MTPWRGLGLMIVLGALVVLVAATLYWVFVIVLIHEGGGLE